MANNPYELPTLPMAPNYDNIISVIRSIQGIPTLQDQLSPLMGEQAKYLQPQVDAIRNLTSQNVAAAQTDAMKRGLTGSSIESFGMGQARRAGQETEAGMRGQFGLSMTELLARAIQGDTEAAQQLRYNLAQAMGQELSGQRELSMFQQQLQAMNDQAAKNRKASLWGAAIGGGGAALTGLGNLGNAASMRFSDSRLKKNVRHIKTVGGIGIVEFEWNEKARDMGQQNSGKCYGVIAQQVRDVCPGAVSERDGYLEVNYSKLPGNVRKEIRLAGGY